MTLSNDQIEERLKALEERTSASCMGTIAWLLLLFCVITLVSWQGTPHYNKNTEKYEDNRPEWLRPPILRYLEKRGVVPKE